MTTATLIHIGKPSDPWGDNRLIFIDLQFADHAPGSLATNEKGVESRLRDLTERLNKPAEYEFADNGRGGFKVKLPKPEEVGGGKGSSGKWQPKSKEERAEILAMNAMNAWATILAGSTEAQYDRTLEVVEGAMDRLMAKAHQVMGVGTSNTGRPEPGSSRGTPVSDNPGGNIGRAEGDDSRPVSAVPTSVESGTDPEFGEGSRDVTDSTERTGHDLRPVPPVEEGDGSGVLPSNGAPPPPGDGPMLIEIERERLGWTKGALLKFARAQIGEHITTLDWSVLSEDEASKLVKALEES